MKLEERAMQLWSVLVLAARSQQLISYSTLADITNLPNAMGNFLKPVAEYCDRNKLPQITSIVVNQKDGTPGKYYTGPNAPTDQFESHEFDWLAEIRERPVTPESFRTQEQAAHS
jgi:hypothetical protein